MSSHLDGVLAGPLSGGGLVAGTVGLVNVGDLWDEWVVRVWVGEHRANRKENCRIVSIRGRSRRRLWQNIPLEMVNAGDH